MFCDPYPPGTFSAETTITPASSWSATDDGVCPGETANPTAAPVAASSIDGYTGENCATDREGTGIIP